MTNDVDIGVLVDLLLENLGQTVKQTLHGTSIDSLSRVYRALLSGNSEWGKQRVEP